MHYRCDVRYYKQPHNRHHYRQPQTEVLTVEVCSGRRPPIVIVPRRCCPWTCFSENVVGGGKKVISRANRPVLIIDSTIQFPCVGLRVVQGHACLPSHFPFSLVENLRQFQVRKAFGIVRELQQFEGLVLAITIHIAILLRCYELHAQFAPRSIYTRTEILRAKESQLIYSYFFFSSIDTDKWPIQPY